MAFNENEIEWTAEELAVLRNAALIAKVDEIKNPGGAARNGFWSSTGGAALITVILGGFIGGYITFKYQRAEKEREFQMVGYKDFLEKQQETIKKIFTHVSVLTSASEDLITLSKPELALRTELSSGELKDIKEERKKLRDKYDAANNDWLNERDVLGMLVSYYFPGESDSGEVDSDTASKIPAVSEAWKEVNEAVTKYTECAENWADDPIPRATDGACAEEKTFIKNKLSDLNKSVEATRKYTWEKWENPEKMKALLQKTPLKSPKKTP